MKRNTKKFFSQVNAGKTTDFESSKEGYKVRLHEKHSCIV